MGRTIVCIDKETRSLLYSAVARMLKDEQTKKPTFNDVIKKLLRGYLDEQSRNH